jgi:hypothetical protein
MPEPTPEQVPQWAQELIREVTILNERLPNHIDYTTRNVVDHENRIRVLEQFRWMLLGIASLSGIVGALLGKFF